MSKKAITKQSKYIFSGLDAEQSFTIFTFHEFLQATKSCKIQKITETSSAETGMLYT